VVPCRARRDGTRRDGTGHVARDGTGRDHAPGGGPR
jgi:hypothetical protein